MKNAPPQTAETRKVTRCLSSCLGRYPLGGITRLSVRPCCLWRPEEDISQATSNRLKNDLYCWSAVRRSSVEACSPRSHCASRRPRSSANVSANRCISSVTTASALGTDACGSSTNPTWISSQRCLNPSPSSAESKGWFIDERSSCPFDPVAAASDDVCSCSTAGSICWLCSCAFIDSPADRCPCRRRLPPCRL